MILGEAIEKHGFGEGQRYRCLVWDNTWFEPKLLSPNGERYVGFDNDGEGICWLAHSKDWEYIKPAPKTVTKWLWADKYSGKLSQYIYTEGELPDNWIKLELSATEVPE